MVRMYWVIQAQRNTRGGVVGSWAESLWGGALHVGVTSSGGVARSCGWGETRNWVVSG